MIPYERKQQTKYKKRSCERCFADLPFTEEQLAGVTKAWKRYKNPIARAYQQKLDQVNRDSLFLGVQNQDAEAEMHSSPAETNNTACARDHEDVPFDESEGT